MCFHGYPEEVAMLNIQSVLVQNYSINCAFNSVLQCDFMRL